MVWLTFELLDETNLLVLKMQCVFIQLLYASFGLWTTYTSSLTLVCHWPFHTIRIKVHTVVTVNLQNSDKFYNMINILGINYTPLFIRHIIYHHSLCDVKYVYKFASEYFSISYCLWLQASLHTIHVPQRVLAS